MSTEPTSEQPSAQQTTSPQSTPSAPPVDQGPAAPPPYVPSPSGTRPGADAFDRIRALGIVRPDEGRWVAGVAAGLARRWGVDPILVRGAFVALSLVFGVGMFLYGACWLLLPHPDGRIHAQEVTKGTVTAGFIGAVLTTLFGMPFGGAWNSNGPGMNWSIGPGLFTIAVIAGVIWWFKGRHGSHGTSGQSTGSQGTGGQSTASSSPGTTSPSAGTPTAGSPTTGSATGYTAAYEPPVSTYGAPEPGAYPQGSVTVPTTAAPTTTGPTTGSAAGAMRQATRPWRPLTLVTLGLVIVVSTLVYQLTDRWAVAGAISLAIVGIALVLAGLAGRRGGFLVPVAVILALTSLGGAAGENVDSTPQARTWTPVTAQQAEEGFHVGAGESTIDLTSTALLAGATAADPVKIVVDQGAGQLELTLPAGTPATVVARVGAGRIQDDIAEQVRQGLGTTWTAKTTATGEPVLTVEVSLGAGEVIIGQRAATAAIPSPLTSPSSVPSLPSLPSVPVVPAPSSSGR